MEVQEAINQRSSVHAHILLAPAMHLIFFPVLQLDTCFMCVEYQVKLSKFLLHLVKAEL
jgi:hypothetical protein